MPPFWVASTGRRRIRRLHCVGACLRVPGVDVKAENVTRHFADEVLEYDAVCKDCWPGLSKKNAKEEDENDWLTSAYLLKKIASVPRRGRRATAKEVIEVEGEDLPFTPEDSPSSVSPLQSDAEDELENKLTSEKEDELKKKYGWVSQLEEISSGSVRTTGFVDL